MPQTIEAEIEKSFQDLQDCLESRKQFLLQEIKRIKEIKKVAILAAEEAEKSNFSPPPIIPSLQFTEEGRLLLHEKIMEFGKIDELSPGFLPAFVSGGNHSPSLSPQPEPLCIQIPIPSQGKPEQQPPTQGTGMM